MVHAPPAARSHAAGGCARPSPRGVVVADETYFGGKFKNKHLFIAEAPLPQAGRATGGPYEQERAPVLSPLVECRTPARFAPRSSPEVDGANLRGRPSLSRVDMPNMDLA